MLNIATMQLAADHQNRLRRRADDHRALGEAATWGTLNGLRHRVDGEPKMPRRGGVAGPGHVLPAEGQQDIEGARTRRRKIEATS